MANLAANADGFYATGAVKFMPLFLFSRQRLKDGNYRDYVDELLIDEHEEGRVRR